MKTLCILGSSRPDGDTAKLANAVLSRLENTTLVDLSSLAIGPYSYEYANQNDDFHSIAVVMTKADAIIFASPVYWYSMSAQMKLFFDRMTDMTEIYKPLGKALAGKAAFALSSSGREQAPDSFVTPIADTARYFDMRWGGHLHSNRQNADSAASLDQIDAFACKIAAQFGRNARKTAAQSQ